MTDSEVEEIARLVAKKTGQVVKNILSQHKGKESPVPSMSDNIRQQQIEIIRNGLERYRKSDYDSAIRKMLDHLLQLHGKLVDPNDKFYRTRHNILILKYIASQTMSDREIRKRLGIDIYSRTYDNQLKKGIQEIADLFFCNWDF